MEKILPVAIIAGLLAWASGLLGPDKRARALAKARAAKRRYARARGTGRRRTAARRTGRKLTKAERRAISLRNLAKARRARRAKSR